MGSATIRGRACTACLYNASVHYDNNSGELCWIQIDEVGVAGKLKAGEKGAGRDEDV